MNRAGLLVALSAVAAGGGLWLARTHLSAPSAESREPRRTVAVLGFRNTSGRADLDWVGTALGEMVSIELGGDPRLSPVPTEAVARARQDFGILQPDALSVEGLARLRTVLGADLVVAGRYTSDDGAALSVDVTVRDAATGAPRASTREEGSVSTLLDLVAAAGAHLRPALGLAIVAPASRSALPRTAAAARLYVEGLARLRAFDARGARASLEAAVAAEPAAALPHAALAAAWTALGYDARAAEAARSAYELSRDLPLRERLPIEGRWREAAREWTQAAEVYRALWAAQPQDLEAGLALASALTAAGRPAEAVATLETLRRLPHADDDPRLDLEEARARGTLGDVTGSAARVQDAIRKGEARGERQVLARARLMEAEACRRLEDPCTLAAAEAARALFEAEGDRGGVARALHEIGAVRWYEGRVDEGREAMERALAIARDIGDRAEEGRALNTLAGFLADRGQLAESRKHYEGSLALSMEVGDRDREAVATNNLGILAHKLGDLPTARRALEEALVIAQALHSPRRAAFAWFNLGQVLLDLGQLEEARAAYAQAIALGEEARLTPFLADPNWGLARVQLAEDDVMEARRGIEAAIKEKEKRGDRSHLTDVLLDLSLASRESNQLAQARTEAIAARDLARTQHLDHLQAQASIVLARIEMMVGHPAEARAAADEAQRLGRATAYAGIRLQVALGAAQMEAALGHPAQALTTLAAVETEAHRLGLAPLELEARLARGEALRMLPGREEEARASLRALARDAAAAGQRRLARHAEAAAR